MKMFSFKWRPVLSLVFLLLCSAFLSAQTCGDVDGNNTVNILDALMIAQEYVGVDPSPFNASAADVNLDGAVNIVDALMVAQYYVGLISSLSCGGITPTPGTTTPTPQAGTVVYSVSAGELQQNGSEITLYGLNWFGMETDARIVHGLWTGRQLDDFLGDLTDKGFNALRLPLSPEVIKPGYPITAGPYSGADCEALCDKDGRTALEYTLARTQAAGMFVLLDFHTCNPANLGSALPGSPIGCPGYALGNWLEDLTELAILSLEYTNIVGIDLCNEPYNLSYSEWTNLVVQGGQAVLAVNPDVTIWVEGVGNNSPTTHPANWGQNLFEAGAIPGIPSNRLVFSPHSYGPSVAAMSYFDDSNYPSNMPAIWDSLFGHLVNKGFAVVTGEFGGHYTISSTPATNDKLWQDSFVDYLIGKGTISSFYWCVNPNSGDTGGIYENDWKTWNQDKLQLLQRFMN